MEISRHPLTGQSILATRSRSASPAHPVQVTVSAAGMATSIWLTPGEALAIAAVALGCQPLRTGTNQTTGRDEWSTDDLADLIAARADAMAADRLAHTNGTAAVAALMADADEAEAAADEAEAAEVER